MNLELIIGLKVTVNALNAVMNAGMAIALTNKRIDR